MVVFIKLDEVHETPLRLTYLYMGVRGSADFFLVPNPHHNGISPCEVEMSMIQLENKTKQNKTKKH